MKTMKEFFKKKGQKASEFVDCLSSMAVVGNETSFYAYTIATEWIKSVDRGGLFSVNDACFRLFRSFECVTCTIKSA